MILHNEEPWEKINNANDFDVPMGSYDGAEVCELVGIFLQSELSEVMEKPSYGLYRDDGLGIFRRLGKPDIERRKKRIIQIFKRHGLDITIKANLKIAQYLDVELDLMNNMYRPYKNLIANHCISTPSLTILHQCLNRSLRASSVVCQIFPQMLMYSTRRHAIIKMHYKTVDTKTNLIINL